MSNFTSSSMYDVLPSSLFERITTMRRIVKSTVKIQPLNNGSINSTQSITFQVSTATRCWLVFFFFAETTDFRAKSAEIRAN